MAYLNNLAADRGKTAPIVAHMHGIHEFHGIHGSDKHAMEKSSSEKIQHGTDER